MALDKTIQFRVSSQEKRHLAKAAKDAGMKLSTYLRTVVLARTVVVVGDTLGVVIIPATHSPTASDQRVLAAVERAIETLNGQTPSPATGDDNAAMASPGSGPATSPGEGGLMVGADVPQEPPAPIAASPPPMVQSQAAGEIPGPEETLTGDAALEPGGTGACPHCGGTDGQHQAFCESLTGEPPVEGTEAPAGPPEPEGRRIESREDFLHRRVVDEGEVRLVAEAEWRQITSSGQQPQTASCTNCGTMKSTAVPCPDCGAPPTDPITKGNA